MDYRPPPDEGWEPLWVDDHLVVVDKPCGLLSVPGRGEAFADCMASRVQQRYPDALIVHRLDMDTSGLLLMARGKDMQRRLSELFLRREVHKRYVAVLQGVMQHDEGLVDLPLITDWPNRPRQKVDHELGKPSQTRYWVRARDQEVLTTRVELEPITGRSHQLRVHMQAIGYPIVGDPLYTAQSGSWSRTRLHLHAVNLRFLHPETGEVVEINRAPPF
ncbi:MAG: RluA family pseudouridine synthase [Burkholderiales bacterium]|nr:RluA family pseudouridine synthase [Burkholderiales bacterium]